MSKDPARREPELLTITEAAELLRAPWPPPGTGTTWAPVRAASASAAAFLHRSDDLHSWIDAQHDDQGSRAMGARR